MGKDQKPWYSSSIVTETHNFKVLLFLLHGYYTSKHKNIASLAIAFSRFLLSFLAHGIFGWLVIQFNIFLEIDRTYVSIVITIISSITVLVSQNVVCFGYFMPMTHGVNKKAPKVVSFHTSPLNQDFTRFVCCFTRNTLSTFFCSDLKDYCKK